MTIKKCKKIEEILNGMDDTTYEPAGWYSLPSYVYIMGENGEIIRDTWGKRVVYATAEEVRIVRDWLANRNY
jgi:hypothetical protein